VEVEAHCSDGKAERIRVTNVASFADRLGVPLEVEGFGTLDVDTAYGGDSFVLVDAARLGFEIRGDEARDLVHVGLRITAAASEQLGFAHPELPALGHISVWAGLAVMHARGEARLGDTLLARSIIGSEFLGRIESETTVGDRPAIRPSITGRAWITGRSELWSDPRDPWPQGYRVGDTWPPEPLARRAGVPSGK